MFLSSTEADEVNAAVARVESRTGVQIVTSLVGKSDAYSELPWIAFALGTALAGGAAVFADAWRPDWVTSRTALAQAVVILGTGAAAALLAVFVPPFARLFLRESRRDVEVRQYAESLFLRREVFATTTRTGLLILVSLFERRIEILPDSGLRARIAGPDWHPVIARMSGALRGGRPAAALLEGLTAVESLLLAGGVTTATPGPNELPDRTIEESGV